ncbi:MAG: carbohydrate ABC transporter permease [Clostridiales bacterium]|nr:carbohydrate ABC transporter permease [Clostridiales bacterium]
MRTILVHVPHKELREAAAIDGCSPLGTLLKIILPLSKSILIVITLYYLVGHWNSYFEAMMYLRRNDLKPCKCSCARY